MERPPKYTYSPASEIFNGKKGFLIYNDNQLPICNHRGFGYNLISQEVAAVLIQDINDILLRDSYLDEGDPKKAYSYSEISKHPKFRQIREKQELLSFGLCVQDDLSASEVSPVNDPPIELFIQWDFLFRMSPDPKGKMEQLIATLPAIQWLGDDFTILPGNYAITIEEMQMEEIPFVPQSITNRLHAEIEGMTTAEKLAVWHLHEFFYGFSITLLILWVKGVLESSVLEDAYYVLTSDFSLEEIREIRNAEGDFVQHRLAYLKKYLQAVGKTEKVLISTCIDFIGR